MFYVSYQAYIWDNISQWPTHIWPTLMPPAQMKDLSSSKNLPRRVSRSLSFSYLEVFNIMQWKCPIWNEFNVIPGSLFVQRWDRQPLSRLRRTWGGFKVIKLLLTYLQPTKYQIFTKQIQTTNQTPKPNINQIPITKDLRTKHRIPIQNQPKTKTTNQIPAVRSKLVFSPPIGHAVLIFVDGTWLGKNYFSSVWIPCKRQIMSLLYLTLGKQAGAMCVVASKPVPSRNRMAKLFLWLLRSKSGCLSIAATSTSWCFNYHPVKVKVKVVAQVKVGVSLNCSNFNFLMFQSSLSESESDSGCSGQSRGVFQLQQLLLLDISVIIQWGCITATATSNTKKNYKNANVPKKN